MSPLPKLKLPSALKPQTQPIRVQGTAYRHFARLRIVSFIFIGLFLLTIGVTGFFIYHSIYATINQVQAIILLKSDLGLEAIDFELLERVERAWHEKHATTTPFMVRDPFNST